MLNRHVMFVTFAAVLISFGAWAQEEKPETPWGKPADLLGKEAPEVKLPLLGSDKELNLADHRDKQYVVLDFWTTWCPWCRKSTEHFVKRMEQYKDQKVAFYMVSIGEMPEVVQEYMEKNDLKVNMALDSERNLADRYWVDYIPHIVVIDPSGKVVKVAVGEDKIGPAIDEALEEAFPKSDETNTAAE